MEKFAFGKELRLLTSGDYKAVFDGVEYKASSKHMLLLARTNNDSISRIGFVIAKKNVRSAVHRNRIKRQIRETFRQQRCAIANVDIVVLAKPGLGQEDNESIRETFLKLSSRISKEANLKSRSNEKNH